MHFSFRCPAATACPAVDHSSRACIIVYMLYFRIQRRLTSCRFAHHMQHTKFGWPRRIALQPHCSLPQPFAFAGPNRSPPFLRRSAAGSLFCAAPGASLERLQHGAPLMVRLQRRTQCTAGKLHKDSGVDGRRGGTYLLPSRGGVYPTGPGSDATWRGGRDGMRSDVLRKGRNDGTGYAA